MFKLIIGLGNNDPQYAETYHNVGHLFIDYFAARYPTLRAEKTTGYMNESGNSVARAMKYAHASPENTLIVHDESDLFIGDYKISSNRGAAGHKGVQNVFDVTGATNFTRLRIGIRPQVADQHGPNTNLANAFSQRQPAETSAKSARRIKAEEFVLKKISAKDKKTLEETFARAARELFGEPKA